MNTPGKKNGRLLIGAIIGVSVIGNLYFGWRAVSENTRKTRENPFEYTIENYKQFDPELLRYSEIHTIPLCFQTVSGMAIDSKDNLYVTGDDQVLIMNGAGQLQSAIATNGTALCIAVDKNGDIYLGMTGHIEVWDRKGAKKAHWKDSGDNAMLTSIVVTDDCVYAADAGNRILRKYDKNGNEMVEIGGENADKDIPGCVVPGRFFDVDIDPDGFIWLVNPGRHTLENYTPEGDLRSSWGVYSMEIEGFCGCCNPSHITILDDGRFITSEKGIPRVKVYDRLGNLESVVAGPGQFLEKTEGLDLAADSKGRIFVLDPMKMAVRIFERKIPGV
ncbi:MAG: NHL repeat-containing protein [Candidatus Latescibacterota bacterium]